MAEKIMKRSIEYIRATSNKPGMEIIGIEGEKKPLPLLFVINPNVPNVFAKGTAIAINSQYVKKVGMKKQNLTLDLKKKSKYCTGRRRGSKKINRKNGIRENIILDLENCKYFICFLYYLIRL